MTSQKPKDIQEYKKWLKDKHGIEITNRELTYYKSIVERLKSEFEVSDFWRSLKKSFLEYHDEYLLRTGYELLRGFEPLILTKPFDSFFLKTFRKNVLSNENWPNEPADGWILPTNWYSKINDIIRTMIEAKYLDGVEFMIEKMDSFCKSQGASCSTHLEAREEGYYAGHIYIRQEFEIPKVTWDTESVDISVEIQITTQLQEVIRKLLHKYYEERRKREPENAKWQWDYRSDEFAANYLGHILHYVEGMIMDIRDKQRKKERMS